MADTSKWPERLAIRDTGLHDDLGGPGQRIFTTAGRGYERTGYVRADLYDAAQAEVARLTAALADAETRGAEMMREAAADAVLHLCRIKGVGERLIVGSEAAHLIRALPPRERDGQEGE